MYNKENLTTEGPTANNMSKRLLQAAADAWTLYVVKDITTKQGIL